MIVIIIFNISVNLYAFDPSGIWKSIDGKGNIKAFWKISIINNILSASVLSLPGYPEDLKSKNCRGKFKDKNVIGKAWIYNLKQNSAGTFKNGFYTDPSTGRQYYCELKEITHSSQSNQTIQVEIFMYFNIFGRHQIWEKSSPEEMISVNDDLEKAWVLKDFNNNERFFTFSGPKSSIETNFVRDSSDGKKRVLLIHSKTEDYTGVSFIFLSKYGYWNSNSNLILRILGKQSNKNFFFIIGDVDYEEFIYNITDNWKGWKDIVIPIYKFVQRKDYQPNNILLNNRIDYPILSTYFQFNRDCGDFDLIIGNIFISNTVEYNSLEQLI